MPTLCAKGAYRIFKRDTKLGLSIAPVLLWSFLGPNLPRVTSIAHNSFCYDWLPLPHISIAQSLQESIRGATYSP